MRQLANILMLGAALLGAWIQVACGPGQPAAVKLPELPEIDIESFAAATRSKLQAAYQVAQAKPNDAQAAGKLGMLLQAHGQFGLAGQCYQRAWRLAPRSFRWRYYLGITAFRQGKNDQALKAFQAARGLRPDYGPLLVRLAEVISRAGNWIRAASGTLGPSRRMPSPLKLAMGSAAFWLPSEIGGRPCRI